MAFTQQNEKDGYLFFAIAFNAVPGKTYAAQVVQAYEAGMTTQQIVNEFTTKTAFTDIYGADLSNADFAQSFVSTVTANLTGASAISATVLQQAIADITAALDAGLTVGDVIFNVITNINSKSTADAEWGPLVQLLANKVAVAEALTEGEYALDTTDAGALQAPLANVDTTYASVQDAIAKGGALKALLANALAAEKAEADYAASLGLELTAAEATAIGGGAAEGDEVTDVAGVTSLLEGRLDTAATASLGINYAAYKALTATQKTQAIASAKSDAANDVALAQDALTTANANVNKVSTLAKKGADLAAADAALTAATKAEGLAEVEVDNQVAVYNVGKAAAAQVTETAGEFFLDAGGANTKVIELVSGKYAFVSGTAAATQTALKSVLDAANAYLAADKAQAAAVTAQADAKAAVDALDTAANAAVPGSTAQDLLDAAANAKDDLADAQKAVTDLDAALSDLSSLAAQLTQLETLGDAVTTAGDKLVDAGYTVTDLVAASAVTGTKDVFVVSADSTTGASFALAAGEDSIYLGSGYTVNATADLTKGSNSALEVFFKTNGANTDVYIEQKAFGSSVAGAANGVTGDILKVTITGVTADKLSLQDGFIVVAA